MRWFGYLIFMSLVINTNENKYACVQCCMIIKNNKIIIIIIFIIIIIKLSINNFCNFSFILKIVL